jgi:hypothetical protein
MGRGEIGRIYVAGSRQYECATAYNRSAKCSVCDCDDNVLDCIEMPECNGLVFKRKEAGNEDQNTI